jgi:hypothetical protein
MAVCHSWKKAPDEIIWVVLGLLVVVG